MNDERFHHGNLRAALIAEGIRAMEEQGHAGFSLRELARRAGVTPMAVYRHFADKDALIAAVANSGFQALAEASVVKETEPRARLMSMARAYAGFAAAHPAMYRLMFSEPLDIARVAKESDASAAAYRPMYETISAALGPGADERAVTDAMVRMWSVLHGYVTLRLANRLPRLATVEDRLEAVIAPVIAGL